jgi:ABC-2 type transport system ATP-binding protein
VTSIEASGLTKVYGAKKAVDDLTFTVEPGVVTGFLGPNGAGKSTTMRLMLDLDHGIGTTLYDGRRYSDLKHPLRHIGAVLDAKAVHPTRTARNHLRMLAAANGIGKARVDEVLGIVGLSDVADKKPGKFSLGMAQRLGLAAALLGDPGVLLLDEPANGLDPQGIRWLRDLLKSFAGQGRSVFVSSHLLNEMAVMADSLVVIGLGRMIDQGPMQQFIAGVGQTYVIVRTPAGDALAGVLQNKGMQVQVQPDGTLQVPNADLTVVGDAAFAAGVPVHELRLHRPSLEEAFTIATSGAEEFIGGMLPVGPPMGEPVMSQPPIGAHTPGPPPPDPATGQPSDGGQVR